MLGRISTEACKGNFSQIMGRKKDNEHDRIMEVCEGTAMHERVSYDST